MAGQEKLLWMGSLVSYALLRIGVSEYILDEYHDAERKEEVIRSIFLVVEGESLDKLSSITLESFLRRQHLCWEVSGPILEFMIRESLEFSDVNPADAMATNIRPIMGRIQPHGVYWLEQLRGASLEDVRNIRGIGPKGIEFLMREYPGLIIP